MAFSGELICLIVVSYFTYLCISELKRRRRLNLLAVKNGCQPIKQSRSLLPFSLEAKYKVLRFKGDFLEDWVTQRFHQHGCWTYANDSRLDPSIFTAEPALIQAVLATHFSDWGLGASRANAVGPLLGPGVFTSDGPIWQHSRAVLRPQFARDLISDLKHTQRHVQQLFEAMPLGDDGWTQTTDLLPLILRFTLDVSTQYFVGESMESQSKDNSVLERAFKDANAGVQLRLKVGPFVRLANTKSFREACRTWAEYGTHFVEHAARLRDTSGSSPEEEKERAKYPFLRGLAASTDNNTTLMRDLTIQLLFAGEDTSASLLSFTLRCLAHHAGSYAHLRAEVIAKFGTKSTPAAPITFTSLKECEHLQNVLKETLRLYPPIPFNTREALKDTVLPVGGGKDGKSPCVVAKGTVVKYSVYVMQRRMDLWGSDAAQWKPDRWVGRRAGWEYLPFNGGPRICMGREYTPISCLLLISQYQPTPKIKLTC